MRTGGETINGYSGFQKRENVDTAGEKGYDAGKKYRGWGKLHLAVDTGGLPHAIKVTTADVTDREGAEETLRAYAPNLSKVANVLCDGGYSGENVANAVMVLLGAEAGVVKRNEPRKRRALSPFAVLPKRWIALRSFAWLFAWREKYRRLWKNGERKPRITLQMTVLAFISLLLKRC
jgi:transposase